MRIALVILSYLRSHGGVERYVWDLSRGLLKRGHEVHVFCARHDEDVGSCGAIFHNVPVRGLFSHSRLRSFADISAHMVAAEKFDVIHGFGRTYYQDLYRVGGGCYEEYLQTMRREKRGFFRPLLAAANPKHRAIIGLERRTFAPGAYKLISCISRKCKEEIQRHYEVPDALVEIIYNGIDLERFSPAKRATSGRAVREKFAVKSGELLLLFVGSGFERKGLQYAIEAAALASRSLPLKLLVVGRGDLPRYRRLVQRLNLPGRTMFLGRRENTEDFYAAADIFLFPSLYEPFGTVVLEAMATAVPAIVSGTSGASEIMTHGIDALVVRDATSSPEVARHIEHLADPTARARMGEAARQTAMNFSIDANIEKTLRLYERIRGMKE
jgi:UDP-glucose:(heptosyl)LPS alpha-1,3-glucosyltransferase